MLDGRGEVIAWATRSIFPSGPRVTGFHDGLDFAQRSRFVEPSPTLTGYDEIKLTPRKRGVLSRRDDEGAAVSNTELGRSIARGIDLVVRNIDAGNSRPAVGQFDGDNARSSA